MHMKNCKNCHNELEIYYTLMVGMKQLNNNEVLSTDFDRDLEHDLNKLNSRVRNRHGVKVSAFSLFIIFSFFVILILYTNVLARVYNFEQNTKALAQGTYYFSDELGDVIIDDSIDRVRKSEEIENAKLITDFERIRGYQRMEKDLEQVISVGEDILNEKAAAD